MADTGDAQALIDAVKEMHAATIQVVNGKSFAVVPAGMRVDDLKDVLNSGRVFPERRKGTVSVQDIASMVEICTRFKGPNLVLFADRNKASPKLSAIFNFHTSGPDSVPVIGDDSAIANWCDHRAVYNFPRSIEFMSWVGISGAKLSLSDFAAFIDDHIGDVCPPPDSIDLTDDRFPGLTELAGAIGGRWASPADMMALSRGLSVHIEHKVKEVRNASSGEASLLFDEEHKDTAGAPIKVPGLFMIAVPIFEEGPLYRIACRLRYRVSNGSLRWSASPLLLDRAFGHAFAEACNAVRDQVGAPLVYGVA